VEFRALATGIAAGTVALCVHSVFVNSLLTPFVMEPLFVLWGLSFSLARSVERPVVLRADPSPLAAGTQA
jgi:predicted Na+-dependent transporter